MRELLGDFICCYGWCLGGQCSWLVSWEVGRSQLSLVPGVFKGVVINFLDKFVMLSGSLRYGNEAKRLLGVLEKRLEGRDFLIDGGYSIADMATGFYGDKLDLHKFPLVKAWVDRRYARPPSAKGTAVCFIPY